jgi:hypothetical protein
MLFYLPALYFSDYILLVCVLIAVICFVVQLIACLKAKNKFLKILPVLITIIDVIVYVILVYRLMSSESWDGSGLVDPRPIVAGLLAMVVGGEILGNMAAWLTYGITCLVKLVRDDL